MDSVGKLSNLDNIFISQEQHAARILLSIPVAKYMASPWVIRA